MNNKILIIDLETTGFHPKNSHIVEIGIVELDLNNGKKKILFDKVIRPNCTLKHLQDSWIIKNCYMSEDEIIKAKDIEHYRYKIQEMLYKYDNGATAFNNAFDFRFTDYNGFIIPEKLDCPMKLSTDICKIIGKNGKYKWPSVQEAYDFFFPDNNYNELHRGADDAFHEADIVYELFKMGIFKI